MGWAGHFALGFQDWEVKVKHHLILIYCTTHSYRDRHRFHFALELSAPLLQAFIFTHFLSQLTKYLLLQVIFSDNLMSYLQPIMYMHTINCSTPSHLLRCSSTVLHIRRSIMAQLSLRDCCAWSVALTTLGRGHLQAYISYYLLSPPWSMPCCQWHLLK